MKKNVLLLSISFFLFTLVTPTHAWYQGYVTNVFPVDHMNGRVYIVLSGGNGDSPRVKDNHYWIDPNSAVGKSLVATALTAKLTNKMVWVGGDGAIPCHEGWPADGAQKATSIDLKG